MKSTARANKHLTLRAKLNWFIFINTLLGLVLVASGFAYYLIQSQFHEKGDQALRLAQTVAKMPQVVNAFRGPHPALVIQPFVEQIRKEMGAEFIVVGNMQLIRYSHPNPNEIGKKMVGGDDQAVLAGKTSVTQAVGTLGLSIRGKSPVFDQAGRQIGVVSVGFLVEDIWEQVTLVLLHILGFGIGGLVLSLLGAFLLSGHVKRQIFGMEPFEIAHLVKEQSAILQSIQEGILAVDSDGRITACNDEAKRILSLESIDVLGKGLTTIVSHARLCQVANEGPNRIAQPMVIGSALIVVNRVPVLLNDEAIGAVITFRDKLKLDQIEKRLGDIEHYADVLRSQRHEFMNRLHTISGLIHLEEYDLVRDLIDQINIEQHHVLTFFANRIRDPAVLAIIVGKLHRAREVGVQLNIDPESILSERCPHREVVVTVLGNAIDNAIEAICSELSVERESTINVSIHETQENLILTVTDSGPGIDASIGQKIFDDGVTTKGLGRGLGLSLCSQLVARVDGQLVIRSSPQGAVLELTLLKGAITYAH